MHEDNHKNMFTIFVCPFNYYLNFCYDRIKIGDASRPVTH